MELRDAPKIILAACYRAAYLLHHGVFLRPGKALRHARLIVVGSFRVGGAGKTPFCVWLAKHILDCRPEARIAVLCHRVAVDELNFVQSKLPEVKVVATSNRYRTAGLLDDEYDFIVCDDGFEDSRLVPEVTIRLDWEAPPTRIRDLIPAGRNRSLLQDHGKPAVALACGVDGSASDVMFRVTGVGNAMGASPTGNVVALCGIGDPERFFADLEQCGISLAKKVARPDHDENFECTLARVLADGSKAIITEKDYARLKSESLLKNECVFVACQEVLVAPQKIAALDALLFFGT